jgi:hypothetical protein
MSFCFNAPFNSVSFGQVSTALAREFHRRGTECLLSPIGGSADLNSQALSQDFVDWFSESSKNFSLSHSRDNPTLKLWHLNDGLLSPSKELSLFTFYELDSPTESEINIGKNCTNLIFSSKYSAEVFSSVGVESVYVPLAFDKDNFSETDKKYFSDGRIVFNLTGKFEKRKHHAKILKAWAKKFGSNKKYYLQCAVFNPFFSPEDNNALVYNSLGGEKHFNISFLGPMQKNSEYNDYLNSSDIIIGMSGGEGWGLPEFQSVALGKHSVILNAHGYKEWANEDNSILIDPQGKTEAYDGVFFKENNLFNQGSIFDFNEDDFISGCEEAIKRVEESKHNKKGVELQKNFSIEKTADALLELV